MGLPDERGRTDILEHYLRGLKLDPRLAPDQLAAELAGATQGFTVAAIAFLCQRAAMVCVKDTVGANNPNEVAITRRHFDAALALLTAVHTATDTTPESSRLLLAG